MKKKTFFVAVTFLLTFPILAVAQENKNTDEAAIRQAIQYYFDGWKNYDAESLKKALHPKARMFYQAKTAKNELVETTGQHLSANFEHYGPRKTVETFIPKIESIDVTKDVATAKVVFSYPDSQLGGGKVTPPNLPSGVVETRYLSLIKLKDGWKIVSEVFSVREGQVVKRPHRKRWGIRLVYSNRSNCESSFSR